MVKFTITVELDNKEVLEKILEIEKEIKMIRPELQAYAEQVNQATNRIAERIQALIDSSTGLSQEEKDLLAAQVATLNAMGNSEIVPREG